MTHHTNKRKRICVAGSSVFWKPLFKYYLKIHNLERIKIGIFGTVPMYFVSYTRCLFGRSLPGRVPGTSTRGGYPYRQTKTKRKWLVWLEVFVFVFQRPYRGLATGLAFPRTKTLVEILRRFGRTALHYGLIVVTLLLTIKEKDRLVV